MSSTHLKSAKPEKSRLIPALLTSLALLASFEAGLKTLNILSHETKFNPYLFGTESTTGASVYPRDSNHYIKIALVGDSAMSGMNAEKSVQDFLRIELHSAFPNQKFYLENLATAGHPFHGYTAEIVKAILNKFDYVIIYDGSNEHVNFERESSVFRKLQFRGRSTEDAPPIKIIQDRLNGKKSDVSGFWTNILSSLYTYCLSHSNLLGTLLRAKEHFFPQGGKMKFDQFKLFEPQPLIGSHDRELMIQSFKKDLEDIASRAQEAKTEVLISSQPSNWIIGPFFSVSSPEPAEVSFEEGRLLLSRRNYDQAYLAFTKSIDHDGFLMRTVCADLFEIESRVRGVHYVDTRKVFLDLLKSGITEADLFADLMHITALGHAVLTHTLFCKMIDVGPIRDLTSKKPINKCRPLDVDTAWRTLGQYRKDLGVRSRDIATAYLQSARFLISFAALSAHRDDLLQFAKTKLESYVKLSEKTGAIKSVFYFWLGILNLQAARSKEEKTSAVQVLNKSLSEDRGTVENLIGRGFLATAEPIRYALSRLGVQYVSRHSVFEPLDRRE